MADHSCGINGYRGVERSETPGIFSGFLGLFIANILALIAAQKVYDRDCPNNCDDTKRGIMSFKFVQFKLTQVPVSPPPGIRRRLGWLVRIKWRLWVSCQRSDHGDVENTPTNVAWSDLEALFAEHYNETNLNNIDTHLTGVGSGP